MNSIRKRGLISSFRHVSDHLTTRIKYPGLNFGDLIELNSLNVKGDNKEHATAYYGTTSYNFYKILSVLQIDVTESFFLDIGCGKGKAVYLAAKKGVKNIYGIEFAKELYDICIENVYKFKGNFNSNIYIYYEDAATFNISENINIIFLNNPFDEVVMKKVLINVRDSLNLSQRKLYIIYFNPVLENLILNDNYFKIYEIKNKNKIEAALYTN